jgi:hypothetical protein
LFLRNAGLPGRRSPPDFHSLVILSCRITAYQVLDRFNNFALMVGDRNQHRAGRSLLQLSPLYEMAKAFIKTALGTLASAPEAA